MLRKSASRSSRTRPSATFTPVHRRSRLIKFVNLFICILAGILAWDRRKKQRRLASPVSPSSTCNALASARSLLAAHPISSNRAQGTLARALELVLHCLSFSCTSPCRSTTRRLSLAFLATVCTKVPVVELVGPR